MKTFCINYSLVNFINFLDNNSCVCAIRKPPKSKLSNKLMVYSFLLFLIILFVLLSAYTDSFFFTNLIEKILDVVC